MSATAPHILTQRIIGLERTIDRLTVHVNQLQRQVNHRPRVGISPTFWSTSIWSRLSLRRRGRGTSGVRENKRIMSHVVTSADHSCED